jgi:TRAP-type C4-dicarboxylate transport system permease small subunit
MFVLLSTMGGALASKDNSHFTLDLITGMMKPTMQKRFLIFNTFLTFIAAAALFISGITMVMTQMKIGSLSIALKVPAWIYGSFVPIGLFFILYRSIEVIIHTIKGANSFGSREEDDKK